ncbi:hypothetical protein CEF21_09975 [Bacillus sp. FJAT-42376]|nr:hypothetical protein CEF21_09975 [Bacillus sp. FJAT-42376]
MFRYLSQRAGRNDFKREIKVYECEDCSNCPLRAQCTRAKNGNNRKVYYNETWEQQKNQIKQQLSEEKTDSI